MKTDKEYYYDELGNRIHEGDLLRVWHFRGARRRVHYMYHIALKQDWGESGLWWAAKMYYAEGNKGHYNLRAVADPESGIIRGTRVIDRRKWDENFKIS